MIDLDGFEGVIRINGSWWKNRVKEQLGKGEKLENVIKAFRTALKATTVTLDDIPEAQRKVVRENWGGNSPAMFHEDKNISGFKVIYGMDKQGNDLYFTFNAESASKSKTSKEDFNKTEKNKESKSIFDKIVEFLKKLLPTGSSSYGIEKTEVSGGIHFTWSMGQGQETKQANKDVENVDIELLLGVLHTTKSAAGLPTTNILKGLQHIISAAKIGGRTRDAYNMIISKNSLNDSKIPVDSCRDCNRFFDPLTGKVIDKKSNEVKVLNIINVEYHMNPKNYQNIK